MENKEEILSKCVWPICFLCPYRKECDEDDTQVCIFRKEFMKQLQNNFNS